MPPFDTSEEERQHARGLCQQPVVVAELESDSAGRTAAQSISLAATGFLVLQGDVVGQVFNLPVSATGKTGQVGKPAPRYCGQSLEFSAVVLAASVVIGLPAIAQAGMPSINLTDLGRMRLNAISFFAAGFLVCAWGIQCLWNLLRRDFPRLPRLTFKAAAGVVFLWGMLFVLVLTMISGARELMTPGAWEKQGLTYQLAKANTGEGQPAPQDGLALERERQLQKLHVALLRYAVQHEGRYPSAGNADAIGPECWTLPDRPGVKYLYVPGRSVEQLDAIVAYEPLVYDDLQRVLRADGRIQSMSVAELQTALDSGDTP